MSPVRWAASAAIIRRRADCFSRLNFWPTIVIFAMAEPIPEPREGLRARKKRALRRKILERASVRFGVKGSADTRIELIAADLEVSAATVFNYFGSKDASLLEIAKELIGELERALDPGTRTTRAGLPRPSGPEPAPLQRTHARHPAPRGRSRNRGSHSLRAGKTHCAGPTTRGNLNRPFLRVTR